MPNLTLNDLTLPNLHALPTIEHSKTVLTLQQHFNELSLPTLPPLPPIPTKKTNSKIVVDRRKKEAAQEEEEDSDVMMTVTQEG